MGPPGVQGEKNHGGAELIHEEASGEPGFCVPDLEEGSQLFISAGEVFESARKLRARRVTGIEIVPISRREVEVTN